MSDLSFSSPFIGIALLVVFGLAGRSFRKNWKEQGENWKLKCWVSGLIVVGCFAFLAFVPYAPR